jgi:hypothetical protein
LPASLAALVLYIYELPGTRPHRVENFRIFQLKHEIGIAKALLHMQPKVPPACITREAPGDMVKFPPSVKVPPLAIVNEGAGIFVPLKLIWEHTAPPALTTGYLARPLGIVMLSLGPGTASPLQLAAEFQLPLAAPVQVQFANANSGPRSSATTSSATSGSF